MGQLAEETSIQVFEECVDEPEPGSVFLIVLGLIVFDHDVVLFHLNSLLFYWQI